MTATGLALQAFGGVELTVDKIRGSGPALAYKGVMMSGVPNLAGVFGYINASWTLKADLICDYVCRLLNFMDRKGVRQVTPNPRGRAPPRRLSSVSAPGTSSARLRVGPSRDRRSHGAFIRTISATRSP